MSCRLITFSAHGAGNPYRPAINILDIGTIPGAIKNIEKNVKRAGPDAERDTAGPAGSNGVLICFIRHKSTSVRNAIIVICVINITRKKKMSDGYDYVVIGGRANHPVYLNITTNGAEIRDANYLWGKDVFETVDELRLINGPSSIIPIGPAGENLVKI